MMLRWAMLFVFVVATADASVAADQGAPRHVKRYTSPRLPEGLPRAHYNYRTTIRYGAPRVYVERDPDVLFTPSLPTIPPLVRTPLLPGSSTLPGYYGPSHSYDYDGPYYGGPYVRYYERLPYACGVYGYC